MERWFWFSDAPVLFHFDEPELYSLVRSVLDELRQDAAPAAQFTCAFETSKNLHVPTGAALVSDGPLGPMVETPGKIFTAAGKEWLIVDGAGSVEVDSGARTASVRLLPGGDRRVAATIALYAIDAALFATGQQLLHGAGLLLPSGAGAVLLFAPSGTGKTTTSLALALDGFGMLTDDALVLGRDQAPQGVWGLPRPMKVHWRTVELMPVLKSVVGTVWNDEGEQVLTRDAFSKLGRIASRVTAPIAAIFLLGNRSDGEHRIENASKADIMVALASDNVGTSRLGVLPRQVRKMEAVANVLNQVPAARLHVGQSLGTLSPVIVDYCEQRRRQPAKVAASA
jgi:hypothetical protein